MVMRDLPEFFLHRLCFTLLLFNAFLKLSLAQTTTAITPDGSLNTTVSQSGSVHTITGGTMRGPNLFHSFAQLGEIGAL